MFQALVTVELQLSCRMALALAAAISNDVDSANLSTADNSAALPGAWSN